MCIDRLIERNWNHEQPLVVFAQLIKLNLRQQSPGTMTTSPGAQMDASRASIQAAELDAVVMCIGSTRRAGLK